MLETSQAPKFDLRAIFCHAPGMSLLRSVARYALREGAAAIAIEAGNRIGAAIGRRAARKISPPPPPKPPEPDEE